jgi:hypothetical protein
MTKNVFINLINGLQKDYNIQSCNMNVLFFMNEKMLLTKLMEIINIIDKTNKSTFDEVFAETKEQVSVIKKDNVIIKAISCLKPDTHVKFTMSCIKTINQSIN